MKYTSAEAAKLLRQLNEDYAAVLTMEAQSREFLASVGEDVESVRPVYDYAQVQTQLEELEQKIRVVKHAINIFNSTTVVADFDMTIDQLLVYIPQLTQRKNKLSVMKSRLPKAREPISYGKNIIDYRYANYDITEVEADYIKAAEELSKAQTALDLVNSTQTMEIDL